MLRPQRPRANPLGGAALQLCPSEDTEVPNEPTAQASPWVQLLGRSLGPGESTLCKAGKRLAGPAARNPRVRRKGPRSRLNPKGLVPGGTRPALFHCQAPRPGAAHRAPRRTACAESPTCSLRTASREQGGRRGPRSEEQGSSSDSPHPCGESRLPCRHPPRARLHAQPLRDARAWLQPRGPPGGAWLPSPAEKPSQTAPAFLELLVNELRGF